MKQPYTMGRWTVKAGSEGAFVEAWKSFASWTSKNQRGAQSGHLLQDTEHPQQFVSFGAWDDIEAIRSWRGTPEFDEFVSIVRTLCEDFRPHSLQLVATSE